MLMRGATMSRHAPSRRWPVYHDRFLEGAVATLWRRRQAIARHGLDVYFGGDVYGEWLEVIAPQRCDRAVVLELHPKNRGHVYVERVRSRRRTVLLRLEDLWFVNAPARLVEAFEQSLLLVSSQRMWGAIAESVCGIWDDVTLRLR